MSRHSHKSYPIQAYAHAIKQHYGRSKYRAICTLYGTPERDRDYSQGVTKSKELFNTRDFTMGRLRYSIEVDSPEQTRVQIIVTPHPFPRWFVRKYINLRYGTNKMTMGEYQAFSQTPAGLWVKNYFERDIVYWNPTPQFIVSTLPEEWFISIKLLYAKVLWYMGGMHKFGAGIQAQLESRSQGLCSYSLVFTSLAYAYREGISSHHIRSNIFKYAIKFMPWYITSFSRLERIINKHYPGYRSTMLGLVGGFYGVDASSYCLDLGVTKITFEQSRRRGIIEYYLEDRFETVPVTYWRLRRLLKSYDSKLSF